MEKKTFKLETQWGETMDVQLDINNYMNNDGLYIGLNCIDEEGDLEPYGDMTTNLSMKAPDYCAYVDINNMPELEKFIEDNELGEFTGLTQRSGYVEYPLYFFNVNALRKASPSEMEMYEARVGNGKMPDNKEKLR